jgi:hypothetical protein
MGREGSGDIRREVEMMRRSPWNRIILAPILAGVLVAAAGLDSRQAAWAGADDLFGDSQGHPPQFIGIVRDVKSFKPIPGARVTAGIPNHGAGVTTYSDAEGRFRIEGFNEDTKLDTVEIHCSKPGFKVVNTIRRKISSDPQAPIEVECLNEPG